MPTLNDLRQTLHGIDHKGYVAYKRIEGAWQGDGVTLVVDRVQPDPFATPSKARLRIPAPAHGIPRELWANPARQTATEDFLLRAFAAGVRDQPRGAGAGRSGVVQVDAGGAEVLARSACALTDQHLELRFRVGLPAAGRSVLGREAAEILCRRLSHAAQSVLWPNLDQGRVQQWADLCDDHAFLQNELKRRGLVAFVRNGSVLPRASGVSQQPLADAVPFVSPPSLLVRLPTRHHGEIEGMGIPEGVTLITGGGFHGKTTLLEAVQRGVYPHMPGDGREWVVTRAGAVKVRSEDGRAVTGVDLRPFIHDLPGGASTAAFTTPDASGSTSLAAAILEAVEAGADVLMLDEDTASTNLLVRDARMQALVRKETITPLVDRVRELSETLGVSTLLVVGGSGDYLDVADTVIVMEDYRPREVTAEAKRVAQSHPTGRAAAEATHPLRLTPRTPLPESFAPPRGRRHRVRARGLRELVYGDDAIDLSALEQLVDDSQARAIGAMLTRLRALARPGLALRDLLRVLFDEVETDGLYALDPSPELALPRPLEVAATVNRLRGLTVATESTRPHPARDAPSGAASTAPPRTDAGHTDRHAAPSGRRAGPADRRGRRGTAHRR